MRKKIEYDIALYFFWWSGSRKKVKNVFKKTRKKTGKAQLNRSRFIAKNE